MRELIDEALAVNFVEDAASVVIPNIHTHTHTHEAIRQGHVVNTIHFTLANGKTDCATDIANNRITAAVELVR